MSLQYVPRVGTLLRHVFAPCCATSQLLDAPRVTSSMRHVLPQKGAACCSFIRPRLDTWQPIRCTCGARSMPRQRHVKRHVGATSDATSAATSDATSQSLPTHNICVGNTFTYEVFPTLKLNVSMCR